MEGDEEEAMEKETRGFMNKRRGTKQRRRIKEETKKRGRDET